MVCVCLFVCFFFCFYVVRSLEKEDFLENTHLLSCFVQSKSVLFHLFCVLDFFFFFLERWQSTLFQIFFFFFLENLDNNGNDKLIQGQCTQQAYNLTEDSTLLFSSSAGSRFLGCLVFYRQFPPHFVSQLNWITSLSTLKTPASSTVRRCRTTDRL